MKMSEVKIVLLTADKYTEHLELSSTARGNVTQCSQSAKPFVSFIKKYTLYRTTQPFQGQVFIQKKWKYMFTQRFFMNVWTDNIYLCLSKMETTHMPFSRWMVT